MDDRSWAQGMSQEVFEKEWVKRFPFSDVIPDVERWVKPEQKPTTFINRFNPEQLENDSKPKPRLEEKDGSFVATCQGCQRSFIKPNEKRALQALKMHQKKCEWLKKKAR